MASDLLLFFSWYLAVGASGLIALPLAFRLFRCLPDRGYALARPLGLLTIGYAFWMLGSLGFLRNDAPSLFIAAALVLAAGAAWLTRAGLQELWAWLKAQRGYVFGVEAVFLLAFAALTWARAYNPEIVSTEKPMEFMFINAILRSPAFPPNDAWLSGHAISYYYFGYVIMAALSMLTGVASSMAFNLGLALLFALAITGSLGVAANLIALGMDTAGGASDHRPSSIVQKAFWPALLAPLMILLAGNFYGVLRLAHANDLFRDLQVPAVYYDFGTLRDPNAPAQSLADFSQPPGVRAGLVDVWKWLDLKGAQPDPPPAAPGAFNWDPGYWWWFSGARVTHDKNLIGQETEAITEMPAFSFVLGDMHPHVLALPFVFLAIALGLNWLVWAHFLPRPPVNRGEPGFRIWEVGLPLRALAVDGLMTALILGGLSFLNTWDFPIYLFVVTAALALGLGRAWGWAGLLQRWPIVAGFAGALAAAGILLYLPFYLTFQSQAGGILPNLIYPTRFQQTVVMFAHVLLGAVLFLGWLTVRGHAVLDRRAALWAGFGLVAALILSAGALTAGAWFNPTLSGFADQAIAPLSRQEAVGLMLQRRLVDSFTTLLPATMVGLCAGLAIGVLRAAPPTSDLQPPTSDLRPTASPPAPVLLASPPVLMSLLMLLTGALLLVGPEFVYLRDLFGTRMNTIFKFYFQTWVLWGLAGAFGLWAVARHARPIVWRSAGVVMLLAVAAGLLYTGPALWSKANHFAGPATLDGMAYFAQQYPNDWAAIQWLQANVPGTPVIAEGIGGQYWIEGRFSRISMATGLPTVMGWPGHEGQWRGRYIEQVSEREGAIQQMYQSRDWAGARDILNRYNIDYVIVSDLERQKYHNVFQAKFDQFMRPVFQSGDVTVYRRLDGGP